MNWLIGSVMVLAAVAGPAVVLSRDPNRQVYALAANGVVLTLVFFVLQAPDVALSELAVNTVITPLLFLVTLAAARINKVRQ
jgi:uncharacterized MnhB-related membrane protein